MCTIRHLLFVTQCGGSRGPKPLEHMGSCAIVETMFLLTCVQHVYNLGRMCVTISLSGLGITRHMTRNDAFDTRTWHFSIETRHLLAMPRLHWLIKFLELTCKSSSDPQSLILLVSLYKKRQKRRNRHDTKKQKWRPTHSVQINRNEARFWKMKKYKTQIPTCFGFYTISTQLLKFAQTPPKSFCAPTPWSICLLTDNPNQIIKGPDMR